MKKLILEVLPLSGQADDQGLDASMSIVGRADQTVSVPKPSNNPYISHRTGERLEVTTFPFQIGRTPGWAHLHITHGQVSRQHCEIRAEEDCFKFVDLGSSYATIVGDTTVEPGAKKVLQDGMILVFTAVPQYLACRLRVHIEEAGDDGMKTAILSGDRPTTVD